MNSHVTMHIAKRDGRSYLAGNYFTPPYKLANITEDRRDPYLHLMLMCSSPGVLDGDRQTIKITLEPNSRLHLHTQSYQRLFRMKQGASQSMDVHIGADASFCWLPHPCVPHAASVFAGTSRIFLGPRARLLWGEVLTCGRKLTGEVFAFSSYRMRTEVYIAHRLALLENISLQPSAIPVSTLGQLGGFTHQASLLFIEEGRRVAEDTREQIAAYLSGCAGAECGDVDGVGADRADPNRAGADRVQRGGRDNPSLLCGLTEGPANSLVVRLLGHSAECLYDHLQIIKNIINAS